MGDYIFDKYSITETVYTDETIELYMAEEKESGEKFALKKISVGTFEPFYKKAIKALKKVSRDELDLGKKPKMPVILDVFTEIEHIYLLLEYNDESSLRRILTYPSLGRILHSRYVALRGIASGGFGVIYLVKDLSLPGKYWALKEMQDDGDFEIMEKRFHIEAEMLSNLEHPNIPRINDFFVEREKLYLVMDFVKGETIKRKFRIFDEGELFPEDLVIDWAINTCKVLGYLHNLARPIIFRDLKPDNIMVTVEGKIKLIDFAIARVFEGPKSKSSQTLEREGYAPPEQWVGKAEPRSDIYSLGAILFHLLTGVHPKTVNPQFPSVDEFNPSVSPVLVKIISKALEDKRKNRFQSMEEMEKELLKLYKYKEAQSHLAKAKDYESKGDFFNANFEYMKALELFQGGNYEILTAIARCYEKLGFDDKALEHYDRAVKLDIPDKFRSNILKKLKFLTKKLGPEDDKTRTLTSSTLKRGKEKLQREEAYQREEKLEIEKKHPSFTIKDSTGFSIVFFIIILFAGLALATSVYFLVRGNNMDKEQRKVNTALKTAWSIYNEELEDMKTPLKIASRTEDPVKSIGDESGLDYIYIVKKEDEDEVRSEIVLKAFSGEEAGGTRLIDKNELLKMGHNFYEESEIDLILTEKARPVAEKKLKEAMVMEYALPLFDEDNIVDSVIYCGKIINRNFSLIDKIHKTTFEDRTFQEKPVGTVTIFSDDVRIATNVLDKDGNRAIGTRASQEVYQRVVIEGQPWVARAFVVTHWYITAYEPIKDINGNIIGILYVGYLEDYLQENNKFILYGLWAIIFFATISTMIIYINACRRKVL